MASYRMKPVKPSARYVRLAISQSSEGELLRTTIFMLSILDNVSKKWKYENLFAVTNVFNNRS